MKNVIPLAREIRRVQREIDEKEWEGENVDSLRQILQHLLDLDANGDKWYPLF